MSGLASSIRQLIQPYSVMMKNSYLKTLVVCKDKSLSIAIAEYYKRTLLQTLHSKFGQSRVVVGAHLDKLSNFPPLKTHKSKKVIIFFSQFSGLVAVFKSPSFNDELKSVFFLLTKIVCKLPPNLKEARSRQTLRPQWY